MTNTWGWPGPTVIQHIIENADSNGKTSKSLKKIVDSIIALKTQTEASV